MTALRKLLRMKISLPAQLFICGLICVAGVVLWQVQP